MPAIQLLPHGSDLEVDIMVIPLTDDDSSYLSNASDNICYYNRPVLREPKCFVGERKIRTIATLSTEVDDFLGDPAGVTQQIKWDSLYNVMIVFSCYDDREDQTFKDWPGEIRMLGDNGDYKGNFTVDDLGDLSKTRTISLGIVKRAKFISCGFLGLRTREEIEFHHKVIKYRNLNILSDELGCLA